jgi:hypothetical protein
MKERLIHNWTITRLLYLVLGIAIVVQSVFSGPWVGIAAGAYFAMMGLFAFGCAAGSCYRDTGRHKEQVTVK